MLLLVSGFLFLQLSSCTDLLGPWGIGEKAVTGLV